MPHPPSTPPEPWHSFLTELDQAASEEVYLQCLGGFVVTQLYGFQRPTGDVDVVSTVPSLDQKLIERAREGSELHKKYRVYSSFLVLTNPGIVLDPKWNMAKVADQAKLANLLGKAPKPTWMYRPQSYTIEDVYNDVLRWHDTPKVALTNEQKAAKNRARAFLYKGSNNSNTYSRYLQDKEDYGGAVSALET